MTSAIGTDTAYLQKTLSAKPKRAGRPTAIEEKMAKNTIKYMKSFGIEAGYCDNCKAITNAMAEGEREHSGRADREKRRHKERKIAREIKREEQGEKV